MTVIQSYLPTDINLTNTCNVNDISTKDFLNEIAQQVSILKNIIIEIKDSDYPKAENYFLSHNSNIDFLKNTVKITYEESSFDMHQLYKNNINIYKCESKPQIEIEDMFYHENIYIGGYTKTIRKTKDNKYFVEVFSNGNYDQLERNNLDQYLKMKKIINDYFNKIRSPELSAITAIIKMHPNPLRRALLIKKVLDF